MLHSFVNKKSHAKTQSRKELAKSFFADSLPLCAFACAFTFWFQLARVMGERLKARLQADYELQSQRKDLPGPNFKPHALARFNLQFLNIALVELGQVNRAQRTR
ncbi:MAG: hypothetical protein DKINENOH_05204 [bacterium]|nr:hypothetical protein [bacterium]